MSSFFFCKLQLIIVLLLICLIWFLYELKHNICLSKTVCGIFHFWFHFVFLKFMFLINKMDGLFDYFNVVIPFKIKIIEKTHTQFCSQNSDLYVATRSFKIQWCLHKLELPQNWPGDKSFKILKSKFWEHQFSQ